MGYEKVCVLVVSIWVLILCTGTVTEAQETPACASKLVPCASYLNSTNPPATCCTPLKEALEQEKTCLCNLYNTPGLLASFGINVTQALDLPKNCNLSGDLSNCSNGTAPSPTAGSSPPVAGKDDNGVGRIAGTGISALLMFWVSIILY